MLVCVSVNAMNHLVFGSFVHVGDFLIDGEPAIFKGGPLLLSSRKFSLGLLTPDDDLHKFGRNVFVLVLV